MTSLRAVGTVNVWHDLTGSTTTPVVIPAAAHVGDGMVLIISASLAVAAPTISGWTNSSWSQSTSESGGTYIRYCQSGDPGGNATIPGLGGGGTKGVAVVIAGVFDPTTLMDVTVAMNTVTSGSASATHTTPTTANATTTGSAVFAVVSDKGSPSSTSFSTPTGYGLTASGFGTLSGSTSMAVFERTATTTAGNPYGGATSTASTSLQQVNMQFILRTASATPPVAHAGPDQTGVAPLSTVAFDGSGATFTSPDTGVTHGWTQTSGSPTAVMSLATTANPTIVAPGTIAGTTLVFTDTVTGNVSGLTATDTLSVTIKSHTFLYKMNGAGTAIGVPLRVVKVADL